MVNIQNQKVEYMMLVINDDQELQNVFKDLINGCKKLIESETKLQNEQNKEEKTEENEDDK